MSHNIDLETVKIKVDISINAHKSGLIAVSGHFDCAGNPVSNDEHMSHIKKSVDVINSWKYNVPVIGLWINQNWQVEKIR